MAKPFIEMLFPSDVNFDVPIVAVTGTNGKTTTAKLIAHALKYSGKLVGFAGTTGVEIDGVEIVSGDYSGPGGAAIVLREPTVDHAVLEVARGGIIRRGLGFDSCSVGILLNVDEDHIGLDGVEDIEELSLVKSTVIEVVGDQGVSVLNADDPIIIGLKERAGGQLIFFPCIHRMKQSHNISDQAEPQWFCRVVMLSFIPPFPLFTFYLCLTRQLL